jgi:hypothetical protein
MALKKRIKLRDGASTEDVRLDRVVEFDERSRGYALPPRKGRRKRAPTPGAVTSISTRDRKVRVSDFRSGTSSSRARRQ